MNQQNLTSKDILQKIYTVVFEVSGIETSQLNAELSINEEIAPSSLDRLTLLMALEDEFSGSIAEEELKDILTLGDLIKFVEGKYAEKFV